MSQILGVGIQPQTKECGPPGLPRSRLLSHVPPPRLLLVYPPPLTPRHPLGRVLPSPAPKQTRNKNIRNVHQVKIEVLL